MPIRWDVEQGGEYLVPYAKKELARLKAQAVQQKLPRMSKKLNVSNGELFITASTVEQGIDYVRITGTSTGWIASRGTSLFYTLSKEIETNTIAKYRYINTDMCTLGSKRYKTRITTEESITYFDIVNFISGKVKARTTLGSFPDNIVPKFEMVDASGAWAIMFYFYITGLRVMGLHTSGDTFDVVLVDEVATTQYTPIGIRNGKPQFFVTYVDTDGAYNAAIVGSDNSRVNILTLSLPPISAPVTSVVFRLQTATSGRLTTCPTAIIKSENSESIELIFDIGLTYNYSTAPGQVIDAVTNTNDIYGYSSSDGLRILDSGYRRLFGYVAPDGFPGGYNFYQEKRIELMDGGLNNTLFDKASTNCIIHNGHINIAMAVYEYEALSSGQTFIFGLDEIRVYNIAGIIGQVQALPDSSQSVSSMFFIGFVQTNNQAGFIVERTVRPASTLISVETIFCDISGTILYTEGDGSPYNAGEFDAPTYIVAGQDKVYIYLNLFITNPSNTADIHNHIVIYDFFAGTKNEIAVFQHTASGIFNVLAGAVTKGTKTYCYAVAEDTTTTPKESLAFTNDLSTPSLKYLVTMDQSGTIVSIVKENITLTDIPNVFTRLMPYKMQETFSVWNNQGD